MQVFALADVKSLKLVATVHNSIDASPGDSHASPYREFAQIEKVEPKATQRRIRDSRTAERKVQVGQLRASKSQDLSRRIGERTAKRLCKD